MRARLVLTLLAALLAGSLLGGCGGTTDPTVARAIERAMTASTQYGSKMRIAGTISAPGGPAIPLDGTATVEAGGRRGVFRTGFGAMKLELYIDERHMLMSTAALPGGAGLPPGTRWLRFDVLEVGESLGLSSGPMRRLQNLDPSVVAKMISRADVREAGRAVEGGVPVTLYAASATFEQIAKALEFGDAADKLPGELRDAKMDFELALDGRDRMRSFRVRMAAQGMTMDMTSTITELRRDIRVDVPSGPGVYDMTDALAGLARGGGVGG